MTACDHVRDLLLEAERAELRGVGTTSVAEHVRACPHCALVADRILAETDRLAAYLDVHAAPPTSDILRRAGIPGGVGAVPVPEAREVPGIREVPEAPDVADVPEAREVPRAPGAPSRRAARRRWVWAPVAAAAAAVAVLFLTRASRRPLPNPLPTLVAVQPTPLVEPTTRGTVAVFRTDDPDITVLWFF